LGEIGDTLYVKATSEASQDIGIYAIPRDKPVQEIGYLKNGRI
jgi:hypothetical protein